MNLRNKKFGIVSFLMLATLASCRPTIPPSQSQGSGSSDGKTKIQFWTGFGGAVNASLTPLIADFEAKNPNITVEYETKGGYDNLKQSISQSISNGAYPHLANGYPDHFADYAAANVLINLDSTRYIRNTDPDIGVDLDQYLPNYMVENQTLVDDATTGLPFNKSTEIMVANQTFFDVAKTVSGDATIKVPTTWQELETVGVKLKNIFTTKGWAGKYVRHDGTTIEKDAIDVSDESAITPELIAEIALDFTNLTPKTEDNPGTEFIPFSWDSTSNFFITILRQWGGQYTSRGATFHNGKVEFHKGENRAKTIAALSFFKDLYDRKIVGIPDTFGETLYASNPFKIGRLALTISSSAGIKENLPDSITNFPFKVSVNPIPYNATLPNARYVISQGTNLALFSKGKGNDPAVQDQRMAAWKLLRYLTYEVNHKFSEGTSYFPVTDGTLLEVNENDPRYLDYKHYTEFLARTGGTSGEVATRDTANLQANVYQEKTESGDPVWFQFVDPGFIGSSRVRNEIELVLPNLFGPTKPTPAEAIDEVIKQLSDFI